MSDENKTDDKKTDYSDLSINPMAISDAEFLNETPESLAKLRAEIAEMHAKEVREADPNFWAGMTPAQILSYLGITQEEFDRVFPPGYQQLEKPIIQLTKEERLARIAETRERLKLMKKAYTKDGIPMPTQEQVNEKYTLETDDVLEVNPGLKALLAGIAQVNSTRMFREKTQLNEAVKIASELLSFDAKKAKNLWLENIKRDSNLHNILGTIHEQATKGRGEIVFDYVSTYDQLKLSELGFSLTRTNGRAAQYSVSWSA